MKTGTKKRNLNKAVVFLQMKDFQKKIVRPDTRDQCTAHRIECIKDNK